MKVKILPTLLFILLVMLYSCGKVITEKPTTVQTTTIDIVSSSNSIPLSKAIGIAIKFLQSKNPNTTVTIKNSQTIIKNGIPYFHIINANKGFVVLSPDSAYSPLLAYDNTGNFSFAQNDLNAGLVRWINKHAHELDYIRNNKNSYTDSIVKKNKILWKTFGNIDFTVSNSSNSTIKPRNLSISKPNPTPFCIGCGCGGCLPGDPPTLISSVPAYNYTNSIVVPFCGTFWNQGYPYNQYCPAGSFSGGHVPTGCLPTAMAQIMYYYKSPSTYDWTSMIKYIDGNNPATQPGPANAAGFTESARLVHDIGTSSGPVFISAFNNGLFPTAQFAYYQDKITSAEDTYSPYVFGLFGYSASRTETITDQVFNGPQNYTAYADLLVNEITTNNRPCIISAFPDEVHPWYLGLSGLLLWVPNGNGHSWVCDGSDISTYYWGTTNTYVNYTGTYSQTTYTSWQTISLLHMNWGEGYYKPGGINNDGFYDCSINYTNFPGNINYPYFQTIIYNIHL